MGSVPLRMRCRSASLGLSTDACEQSIRAERRVSLQVERNLHDAMGVARNVMMDPRLVPGGGAVEMAISRGLYERSASIQGTQQVLAALH